MSEKSNVNVNSLMAAQLVVLFVCFVVLGVSSMAIGSSIHGLILVMFLLLGFLLFADFATKGGSSGKS